VPSNGTPQTVRESLQLLESLQSGQSVGHLVAAIVFCGSYRAKGGKVARWARVGKRAELWSGCPKGRHRFESFSLSVMMLSKLIFKIYDWKLCHRIGTKYGFCGHGDETFRCIKGGKIVGYCL